MASVMTVIDVEDLKKMCGSKICEQQKWLFNSCTFLDSLVFVLFFLIKTWSLFGDLHKAFSDSWTCLAPLQVLSFFYTEGNLLFFGGAWDSMNDSWNWIVLNQLRIPSIPIIWGATYPNKAIDWSIFLFCVLIPDVTECSVWNCQTINYTSSNRLAAVVVVVVVDVVVDVVVVVVRIYILNP